MQFNDLPDHIELFNKLYDLPVTFLLIHVRPNPHNYRT